MGFSIAEGKALLRRELWLLSGRNQQRVKSNVLESIAKVKGADVVSQSNEDGVVRMKVLVRKQDLRQMLEAMRGVGKDNPHQPTYSSSWTLSAEQRLNLLRRRHHLRLPAMKGACRCPWSPALQSIPEEL